jgi:hypothetical protein
MEMLSLLLLVGVSLERQQFLSGQQNLYKMDYPQKIESTN